jgi:hypothetical protein
VKKVPLFSIVGIIALLTLGTLVRILSGNSVKARLHSRAINAISMGKELISETNSTMLIGTDAEFKSALANLLASPTWPMLNRSAMDASRNSFTLILTNDREQALHLQLHGDFVSGKWQFPLLSYQKIENRSATNRTLPGI